MEKIYTFTHKELEDKLHAIMVFIPMSLLLMQKNENEEERQKDYEKVGKLIFKIFTDKNN